MKKVFGRPACLTDELYKNVCPGCGYGISVRVLGEVIDDLGMAGDAIAITGQTCVNLIKHIMLIDRVRTLHGREMAVATGVKRVEPDKLVIVMAGDGALSTIGATETIHAASRGEKFTALMLNNATLGMTGGHMSSATIEGQKTRDTLAGRKATHHGYPVKMTEMIALQPGAAYVARVSLHTASAVRQAKEAIRKALEFQMSGAGLSFVDILQPCPIGWMMSPRDSLTWLEERLIPEFPLGEFKDVSRGLAPRLVWGGGS